ncbi:hypothetical protein BU24DRAFT_429244 [Aaosphaeria arxii CBS 175.79]|uniref:Mitotic checkpoint regulator, MAD2B-interacting-domain-containing protein n=1 Tax=Aaosphaeria arxii CBS 175.79 TaxID=1450172 RepID=A0A6A5X7A4_9PLEO|nr:uncharacterized protein BU24DRAFT_429244 [Aaosphaeria arxii CBS 175.79]KAF2008674.1 hypothetical protein BU24DRAFT_429244 [Aaosphaeria arxii CBS 175.79]
MNLIAYSDSEDSDNDAHQAAKPAPKQAPKAFQKVVDRSNPGKIKLNLPSVSHSKSEKDDIEADAPPAKKARTGGGVFGGFNSMLPAPKKPKIDPATAAAPGSRGLGKRLGVGINLKTGAEPAFQRRSAIEEDYDEDGNPIQKEASPEKDDTPKQKEDFRALLNLPPPKKETKAAPPPVAKVTNPEKTQEPKAKPVLRPKLMPMSVARGKKKKPIVHKPIAPDSGSASSTTPSKAPAASQTAVSAPKAKPKVSLFGEPEEDQVAPRNEEQYQPMLYGFDDQEEDEEAHIPDNAFTDSNTFQSNTASSSMPTGAASGSQGLTSIASELNLSEAERRQLFGRKGRGADMSAANIIDFNTDKEYAHNEKLRQAGETVEHRALKSISGTGKTSLRSLINVAATQKEALEEHFAAGRRNKKEAGNKYGW